MHKHVHASWCWNIASQRRRGLPVPFLHLGYVGCVWWMNSFLSHTLMYWTVCFFHTHRHLTMIDYFCVASSGALSRVAWQHSWVSGWINPREGKKNRLALKCLCFQSCILFSINSVSLLFSSWALRFEVIHDRTETSWNRTNFLGRK